MLLVQPLFQTYHPLCPTLTLPVSNREPGSKLQIFLMSSSNLHSSSSRVSNAFLLPCLDNSYYSPRLSLQSTRKRPFGPHEYYGILLVCRFHTYVLILQLDHKLLEHTDCVLYKSAYPPQCLAYFQ